MYPSVAGITASSAWRVYRAFVSRDPAAAAVATADRRVPSGQNVLYLLYIFIISVVNVEKRGRKINKKGAKKETKNIAAL